MGIWPRLRIALRSRIDTMCTWVPLRIALRTRETHSFEVSKLTAIGTTIVESFKQCVRPVERRGITIADVGRDLRVKSVNGRASCGKILLRMFRMQGRPRRRKVTDGTVLLHYPLVVCFYQSCGDVAGASREDAKLGRSPGWNMVRADCSRLCMYAFVQRK